MKKLTKKSITILLAAIMVLCMGSVALAEEVQRESIKVSYTVAEGYTWTVPSETAFTQVGDSKELNVNVSVSNCLLEENHILNISLDDSEGKNDMLLKFSGDEISYEISKNSTSWIPLAKGATVLSVSSGATVAEQTLYGQVTRSPKKAGTYVGELTFVAEVTTSEPSAPVITNLSGYTWTPNDGDLQDTFPITNNASGGLNYTEGRHGNQCTWIYMDIQGERKILYFGDGADCYYIWEHTSTSEPHWSMEPFSIRITDGENAANTDLIAWFQANGTLTKTETTE